MAEAKGQVRAEEVQEKPKTSYVQYVGTSDERILSAGDFGELGFEDGKKTVWSKRNRFRVKVSDLPAGFGDDLEAVGLSDEFKVVEL